MHLKACNFIWNCVHFNLYGLACIYASNDIHHGIDERSCSHSNNSEFSMATIQLYKSTISIYKCGNFDLNHISISSHSWRFSPLDEKATKKIQIFVKCTWLTSLHLWSQQNTLLSELRRSRSLFSDSILFIPFRTTAALLRKYFQFVQSKHFQGKIKSIFLPKNKKKSTFWNYV